MAAGKILSNKLKKLFQKNPELENLYNAKIYEEFHEWTQEDQDWLDCMDQQIMEGFMRLQLRCYY